MASTYSNLKIQLMATGENSGTWGNVTNDNLGVALEEAIVGSEDVTFASGTVTLTLTNTNASQTARNLRLNLVGTTGGPQDLVVPAIEKIYIVNNTCADAVTIKVTGQTGVAVPAGKTMYVYNNGTDCGDAITHLRNLTLATALPPGSGGTGINSVGTSGNVLTSNGTAWESVAPPASNNASALTIGITAVNVGGTGATSLTTENVIIGNGTSAVKFVAPGTTGNVLTSNGSAWLSQAAAAGGGDYIMNVYAGPSSGTWTKPAGLKAVKVTVVAGGGSSGPSVATPTIQGVQSGGGAGGAAIEYLDAPALPGPQPYTAGGAAGASSFGSPAFLSATAGSSGSTITNPAGVTGGAGGSGSGGQLNITGGGGSGGFLLIDPPLGINIALGGAGGSSAFGSNGSGNSGGPLADGGAGGNYGGGGGGGSKFNNNSNPLPQKSGGVGVVIVEEFY